MTEEMFLEEVVRNPDDRTIYPMLADWLEENDDPWRAELLRLRCRMLETCCEPEAYLERAGWQARMVELISEGVRPSVPKRVVELGGEVRLEMHFISPGSFLMGSPENEKMRVNDERQHKVRLTRGFYLGVTHVTRGQFAAFAKATGFERREWSNPGLEQEDDHPVVNVSWEDAQKFCKWLSEKDGQEYRLPTEAEWEYACRAGTSTAYYFGDEEDQLGDYGWFDSEGTHPVAEKKPNAWGLYDMHGNAWQWNSDLAIRYLKREVTDPQGGKNGSSRVLRGGGWGDDPQRCRSAIRYGIDPARRYDLLGFRLAVSVRP